MQRLYFMNNAFVAGRARTLAERIAKAGDNAARIASVYRLLFAREPSAAEVKLGTDFLETRQAAWPEYMQVLLTSAEFSSVN